MSESSIVTARTVALVGRANAGKTSVLMHLTGTVQRPVNFPGTSVERTEVRMRQGDLELVVVDLPGIGSLAAVSRDEQITVDYVKGSNIGGFIKVADAMIDQGY